LFKENNYDIKEKYGFIFGLFDIEINDYINHSTNFNLSLTNNTIVNNYKVIKNLGSTIKRVMLVAKGKDFQELKSPQGVLITYNNGDYCNIFTGKLDYYF